jgi:hypothetical protein
MAGMSHLPEEGDRERHIVVHVGRVCTFLLIIT